MPAPILEVRHLTHGFAHGSAGIFDISFALAPGDYLVLAGPNGSGKTTLIRHLVGLLKPHSGSIRLKGQDIFKDLTAARKTMGLVFQDADAQIVGETVFSEAAFGPENLRLPPDEIKETVDRVLTELDLYRFRDRHPATLSGGEKRRLTIAGILAMNPDILILDEPFTNLDYPSACRLAAIIGNLHSQGRTIVMATHDTDMVVQQADQVLIMDKGRMAVQGSAREIAPRLAEYGLKPWCPACRPLDSHPG